MSPGLPKGREISRTLIFKENVRSLEKKIKPPETIIILVDKKNKMLCIDVLKLRKD